MRHRKSGRKLKRTSSHKKATLNALCTALIRSKRIKTTVAKAKETRMMIEKLITSAKNTVASEGDKKNVHARRMIARYIKDRQVVKELFGDVASKVANRNGGYTRIVKLGQRYGDSAEVAILELVDFNTEATAKKSASQDAKTKKKKEKKIAESEKVAESKK